jgi:hypothetical protein
MELIEQAGTAIAFPSHTVHLADYRRADGVTPPMDANMGRLAPAREDVETV